MLCVECARMGVEHERLNGAYMTAFSEMLAASPVAPAFPSWRYGASDEPRRNVGQTCAKSAISAEGVDSTFSRARSDFARCRRLSGRHYNGLRFWHVCSAGIDFSFDLGAVVEDYARRCDIADQPRILPEFDFTAGHNIALHLSHNDYVPGQDCGLNPAARSDCDLAILCLDCPFNVAVDLKIFFTDDLADDFYSLAYGCGVPRLCSGSPGWYG
jgi:hypothetical protein